MFFRELFRSLLSANLFVTGILLTIAAAVLFYGSIYLFNYTNLGKKLGFLVTGASLFGWLSITSLLFVIYAPRGPKPDNIEGLNALEVRIIPITDSIIESFEDSVELPVGITGEIVGPFTKRGLAARFMVRQEDATAAEARLDDLAARLEAPLPEGNGHRSDITPGELQSNVSFDEYCEAVEAAKEYIAAGDIFQVVPSQRLSRETTP